MTGSSAGSVLAPMRSEAWRIGVRTLLTSAAMLVLIALAAWGSARRERALQQSEKRYRAMIEAQRRRGDPDAARTGRHRLREPSVERLTGYTSSTCADGAQRSVPCREPG